MAEKKVSRLATIDDPFTEDMGNRAGDQRLRDRQRSGEELSLDEVRQIVAESRDGGFASLSLDDLFVEAQRIVEARKTAHS